QSGIDEPLMLFGIPVSIATSVLFILGGLVVYFGKRLMKVDEGYYSDYGKKVVLFDLDGTLLDTIDLIYDNIRQTFKKYFPSKTFTEDELKAFVGPTLQHSFSWYEPNPKKIEEMIELYRKTNLANHEKGVNAYPHAKETLTALKDAGYLIGIVSSKKKEVCALGLEQNDLLQFIDVIIGSDDVTKHKPDKEPIMKALESLMAHPANAIYIGDHSMDIEAAKAAGVKSVGVSYSIHYDKLMAARPDYMIDDLEKLLYIL